MVQSFFPDDPLLIVETEDGWGSEVAEALQRDVGIDNVLIRNDLHKIVGLLQMQPVSTVLLDLSLADPAGTDIFDFIIQDLPQTPVVVLSEPGQPTGTIEWMRHGAFDHHPRNISRERLLATLRRAVGRWELQRENRELRRHILQHRLKNPEAFADIITCSDSIISLFRYIEAVAVSSEPVLITGESGAGKELFARAIHRVCTPQGPWVAVNAAGLDDLVFADTLFGHSRGAFTGAEQARAGLVEKAAGGTLFLDEIGDLSAASQVKLLRLLQEKEYFPLGSDTPRNANIRIVFATNQDLAVKKVAGEFRRDLYYRLCTHHLHIPPLRDRPADIAPLVDHFLEEAAANLGRKKPTLPAELLVLLSTYHFPGNLRELRGMVYNALSLHRGGKLSMEPFRRAIRQNAPATHSTQLASYEALLQQVECLPTLKAAGDLLASEALRRSGGNQKIAASILGISPPALSKRRKKAKTAPDSLE